VDFYQARFENTMRLKDAWAQLAQRYARPLNEDDIIDLREVKILKDRGIVRNLNAQVDFGNVSLLDELGNDASSEAGVHSEDEDDFDEIDAFSHSPRVQNRLEAQLRRVKPLHDADSKDEDDLREFLEAERRMREEFGPVDEDFSEHLVELQEQVADEGSDLADEVIEVLGSSDEECEHQELSRTFTRSTDVDCDSEGEDDDDDELGGWEHDESNAIYEVVRTPVPEVIEIFDTPPSSPPSSPLTMSMSDSFSRSSSIRAGST
jgi:Centromere protein Scm3